MTHPDLLPLLESHGITLADFSKKGRLPKGESNRILSARKSVITQLHECGTSWSDMIAITGLSQGAIQRLTGAMWNSASRAAVSRNGVRLGKSWGGKTRPDQLKKQWEAGTFDFFKGRKLTAEQRQHLRNSWTKEHRAGASVRSKKLWSNPSTRNRLLSFHRSQEERQKRSEAQSHRMKVNPGKYARGKSQWVDTPKGTTERVFVRSSYEVRAIAKLEADPDVLLYEYERVVRLPNGRWMLPDFIVLRNDETMLMVEVKSSWVLGMPDDSREIRRLEVARAYSVSQGWFFEVWSEKELGC